jgi:hypothetical protein
MPFLLGLIGLVAAAYIWAMRARAAGQAAQDLAGMAQDVLSAAKRFGFRRRLNIHPVDSLDDLNLVIAGAGLSFLELGGLPTAATQEALIRSLQSRLGMAHDPAKEALILGRWLMNECGGPDAAVTRFVRRAAKMNFAGAFEPLMNVLRDVAAATDTPMTPRQTDALDDVKRAFRL